MSKQQQELATSTGERGAIVKDPEVKAMHAVIRALESLPPAGKRRVLNFLADKYGLGGNDAG